MPPVDITAHLRTHTYIFFLSLVVLLKHHESLVNVSVKNISNEMSDNTIRHIVFPLHGDMLLVKKKSSSLMFLTLITSTEFSQGEIALFC